MPAQNDDVMEASVQHVNTESGDQVNKFQFQMISGAPASVGEVLDDIAAILEACYLLYEVWISIRNVFKEMKLYNITQDLLYGSSDLGTYVGGTSVNPPMPQGVTPYVYFKTDVPRVILTKYLPSPNAASVTADGRVIGTQQTAITAFAAELVSTHLYGDREYVFGYYSPKVLSFVKPNLYIVPAIYGYQRRRKTGRGS